MFKLAHRRARVKLHYRDSTARNASTLYGFFANASAIALSASGAITA
jgi:hypothetical protein